jgi:hypothetical protein
MVTNSSRNGIDLVWEKSKIVNRNYGAKNDHKRKSNIDRIPALVTKVDIA